MNAVSITSSIAIIFGCFMPWLQLGTLVTNRGIDNADGAIMLVGAIISGAVAINNATKKQEENKWVFVAIGILGITVALLDLSEVRERANNVAKGISELSEYTEVGKNVSASNFIGSGLYIVIGGSIGLLLCGVGAFSSKTNKITTLTTPKTDDVPTEIVAPKFAKIEVGETETAKETPIKVKTPKEIEEEIENEKYKEKLIKLESLIEAQNNKMFGGGMNDEIRNLLSELITSKREGIHLLNCYNALFKRELIQDLKKLNSLYATIRENLKLFIQLGIVDDTFPHDRK